LLLGAHQSNRYRYSPEKYRKETYFNRRKRWRRYSTEIQAIHVDLSFKPEIKDSNKSKKKNRSLL